MPAAGSHNNNKGRLHSVEHPPPPPLLRYTGEVVYGSNSQSGSDGRRAEEVQRDVLVSRRPSELLCQPVGGATIWAKLADTLGEKWTGSGFADDFRKACGIDDEDEGSDEDE